MGYLDNFDGKKFLAGLSPKMKTLWDNRGPVDKALQERAKQPGEMKYFTGGSRKNDGQLVLEKRDQLLADAGLSDDKVLDEWSKTFDGGDIVVCKRYDVDGNGQFDEDVDLAVDTQVNTNGTAAVQFVNGNRSIVISSGEDVSVNSTQGFLGNREYNNGKIEAVSFGTNGTDGSWSVGLNNDNNKFLLGSRSLQQVFGWN